MGAAASMKLIYADAMDWFKQVCVVTMVEKVHIIFFTQYWPM
jgi:hypothetical protein